MIAASDSSRSGVLPRPAPGLIPLIALGLAGAALGRALRTTPLAQGRGSRGGTAALLAGAAGLALLQQRHRRVGEIERLLQAAPPGEVPVTQSVVPLAPADAPIGPPGRNAEERLDEAVQETFPASDPISVHIE